MAFPTHSLNLVAASSQYASKASATGFPITANLTVESWIRLSTTPASGALMQIATNYSTSANNRAWWFAVENNGGTLGLNMRISEDGISVDIHREPFTFSTATWYHVAAVFTASTHTVQFFVNAVSIGSDASGTMTSIFNTAVPVVVGTTADATDNFFDGNLSLTRIWATTRTASNFSTNWCTELGSTTNLKAEWPFDSAYTDNSGNSNTLTPTNSPTFSSSIPGTCAPANGNFLAFM